MSWMCSLALALLLPDVAAAAPTRDRLVEIEVRDRDQLATLQAMGLDLWSEHPRVGTIPALTSAAERTRLAAAGLHARPLARDVHAEAARERLRVAGSAVLAPGAFFADFRPLDQIDDQLDAWASADPTRVSVVEIGTSLEGRPIRGVRISADATPRPALLIDAGQHAREWLAVSSALWVVDTIVTHAAEAPYADLLDRIEIVVVPVANPDGYLYTWSGDRYWRKNRRDGHGVDTNRNFAEGWGGEGGGTDPGAEDYRGAAAFSEPESQALRDWVSTHPDPRVYVDVHCFGELLLYPWGYLYEPTDDDTTFVSQSQQMVDAMAAIAGTEYTPLQVIDLYPSAGNSIDWAYAQAGVLAYGMEVRPSFDDPQGFVVGPELIGPTGDEVLAAMLVLADAIADDVGDTSGGSSGGASTGDGDTSSSGQVDGTGNATTTGTGAGSTSAAFASTGDAALTEESTGAAATDGAGGCGCRSATDAQGFALGVVVLLRRRRRRATDQNGMSSSPGSDGT